LKDVAAWAGKPTHVKFLSAIVASFTVFGDVFCDNAVVLPRF
jgi:hypothetical protein